ncbi:DotU family type IV/VI secretion system protein [Alphaproteobacteria bacterium]|nr:DotU family type IV/VI secretion system protein [Alphaproteobacteria bacterium]
MHHDTYLKSIILQDFRIFYRELLLLKNIALEGIVKKEEDTAESSDKNPPSKDPGISEKKDEEDSSSEQDKPNEKETPKEETGSNNQDLTHQTIPHRIRSRLEDLLTNQYKELGSAKGGYAARYYREAQYIMVSLADETFINLNWHGKEEWEDNLLESLLYNTQDAGDKFFENLDNFLENTGAQGVDMASLYLISLGLGFKGKYRGIENEKEIFSYKEKLYRWITSENPELLENRARLFPQTYENIITDRQGTHIPDSRPWWVALSVIALFFIVASSLIWFGHMRSLSPLVNTLEKWSGV